MTSTDTSDIARGGDARSSPGAAVPGRPGVAGGELIAPAKAMRLLGALSDGLDEAARGRAIAAHRAALIEVASSVSDPLISELVDLPFQPLDRAATVDEIKVAQAQLVGWVNGLILAEGNLGPPLLIDASEHRSSDLRP
jgi:Protein of unknown function (DUF2587)